MKIFIGCDHTSVDFKNFVIEQLKILKYEVIDCGTYSKARTHYPIYGYCVGSNVANNPNSFGISICATGVGISVATNRVAGTRCVLARDILSGIIAREKYNANVIAIGAKITGQALGLKIITTFLNTKYLKPKETIGDIKLLNNVGSCEIYNPHITFKKEIQNWEKGKYTNGKKQPKILLPQID